MTANTNYCGTAICKDGIQMGVQQTTNAPDKQKMIVQQSRLNQQMHQTNEDVAMW